MVLHGIHREFKPADEDVGEAFDVQGNRYLTAKDIAEAASLPIHIFQDRAEREVGDGRFVAAMAARDVGQQSLTDVGGNRLPALSVP